MEPGDAIPPSRSTVIRIQTCNALSKELKVVSRVSDRTKINIVRGAVQALVRADRVNLLASQRGLSRSDFTALGLLVPKINLIPLKLILRRVLSGSLRGRSRRPELRRQGVYLSQSQDLRLDFEHERELYAATLQGSLKSGHIKGLLLSYPNYAHDEAARQVMNDWGLPVFSFTKEFPLTSQHASNFGSYFSEVPHFDRGDIGLLANEQSVSALSQGRFFASERAYVTGLPRFDGYRLFAPWRTDCRSSSLSLRHALFCAPYLRDIAGSGDPQSISSPLQALEIQGARDAVYKSRARRITLLDFSGGYNYGHEAGELFPLALRMCAKAVADANRRAGWDLCTLTIKVRSLRDLDRVQSLVHSAGLRRESNMSVSVTEHLPVLFGNSAVVVGYSSTALVEAALAGAKVVDLSVGANHKSLLDPAISGSRIASNVSLDELGDHLAEGLLGRVWTDRESLDRSWTWAARHVTLPTREAVNSQRVMDVLTRWLG